MTTWHVGNRVSVDGETGYIFSIEHDWAAVVLDKVAHRANAPIMWAKLTELKEA